MSNVYIVKSGRLVDFSGWEWLNLRAFNYYTDAFRFAEKVKEQIKPDDLGEVEDVEIEELTLEV
jgi:hypothetical protein